MTNNPVYHFFYSHGNAGPLVLRLATAGIFFFNGTQKAFGWFGGSGLQNTLTLAGAASDFGLSASTAPFLMVVEIVLCLSLFFGLFTRLAGLAVVMVMSAAFFAAGKSGPFFLEMELPLMIWATGLALFCMGGGALSLDRAISNNLLPAVG